MHFSVVQRILGLLLMLFSITMLPPIAVSFIFHDHSIPAFLSGFAITLLSGLFIWLPVRGETRDLRLRDGFLVVAAFWIVLGSFGAAPLVFSEQPSMTLTDALFESISGLTTTGATVLTGLDDLPRAILYYRGQLQWLGGMGIIVLAVAVLPMLGVGGMQLYRAETPGPVKDSKLTPRIAETAKALWYVYFMLTLACALAYWSAGMSAFDAICHAFSTISTGGFSTHDASMGYFQSPLIDGIGILFMGLAGVNFSLHFLGWRGVTLKHYAQDPEFRAYVNILLVLSTVVVVYLLTGYEYDSALQTAIDGMFQLVSFVTSTGFSTADFPSWPGSLPVLLLFASFIGGCGGSTAGGIKVIRCLLLYKQGRREIRRLVHPNAEVPVKLGSVAVSQRVVDAVWGFFAVYVVLFALMMVILLSTGVDQVTAFSAIAASLNNLGPGLGEVSQSFASMGDVTKWVCTAAMLLGRLEIFTLLVLVSRTFWQQ